MDIRMPGLDGLRAAETILGDSELTAAVVMLTTFDIERYVYDALRLGGRRRPSHGAAPPRPASWHTRRGSSCRSPRTGNSGSAVVVNDLDVEHEGAVVEHRPD